MRFFCCALPVLFCFHVFAGTKADPIYRQTDYGPSLNWTYQVAPGHIAYKGIAVRLDDGSGGIAQGSAWMVFDHDVLSMSAGWTRAEGAPTFIDWRGVAFDGSHNSHASIAGKAAFVNAAGPGYANPATGSWNDSRFISPVNKRIYGPLPREWGHYKGMYRHGNRVVFSYTVGEAAILEMPGYDVASGAFTRTFQIASRKHALSIRLAPETCALALAGTPQLAPEKKEGAWMLTVPPGDDTLRFTVLIGGEGSEEKVAEGAKRTKVEDLDPFLKGGPDPWREKVETTITAGKTELGFVHETLSLPDNNPWKSWMRAGGFDFFEGGKRAALCTWNGDVWVVDGIDGAAGAALSWKRIASGLFQPLGLKIVRGEIYVSCRDQIARLRDLNNDGCVDFYESFNSDHQVTEHFHEFAMGLQTDKNGNFYYAKSARHALPALVPHHGTLIRVSADGRKSDIIASGFRAANGVCVNDDGTFFVTDQEGHWTPKNRINLVKEGGFYGNMMGWVSKDQSPSDDAMQPPLAWITNKMDRSPGELVKIDGEGWGELNGQLLNCSYGMGKIFLVLREQADSVWQGGVVALPLLLPTGVMRGRFHPSGGFYACGLFGWSSNRTQPGGFYRIRRSGSLSVPISLSATKEGLVVGFDQMLDPASATDAGSYEIRAWGLKRSNGYGSKHIDEKALIITNVKLLPGGKAVCIQIEGLAPIWSMSINMRIKAADGTPLDCLIHNTIHALKN